MKIENIWFEKYRPKNINEMVLPDAIKNKLEFFLNDNAYNMPHLGLFSRTPGTGKTSLAKAIISQLNAEAQWINASLNKGIDVLRSEIQAFVSQVSFKNTVKIVVLDEFDYFTKDGQAAFRGFIDQFSKNVRFIFTGNYKENVIDPLLDRLEIIDFDTFTITEIAKPMYKRLTNILENENVEYNKEDLISIIKLEYPRIRSIIKTLQSSILETEGHKKLNIVNSAKIDPNNFLECIKSKNLPDLQHMCFSLDQTDFIFTELSKLYLKFDKSPEMPINAIIIIARYQYQNNFVRDKKLNVLAMCCELSTLY